MGAQRTVNQPPRVTMGKVVPRGRLYDCDGCGDEFRYEHNDDEGSGLTKICNECRKHGPRCLGGCGVRSKSFGAAGKTHCAECKAKRTAAASAPASSRSLLSTGYVQGLADRMRAADEKTAAIAPSPMFARSAPPPAHHIELRSRIADEPVPTKTVIEVIGQNRGALGQPVMLSPDDPFWREHAPPQSTLPVGRCDVLVPIEAPDATEEPEIEQQPEEKRPMAREATCQKSAGGCGIVFKTKSTTGKLPMRCDDCKAKGKGASGGKPRKAKAPRGAPITFADAEHDLSKPLRATRPLTLHVGEPLFTVRVGQLAIDCNSVEAVDALVQRYGAAS